MQKNRSRSNARADPLSGPRQKGRNGYKRELRGTVIHWDRDYNGRAMCGRTGYMLSLATDMAIVTCLACCDIIDPPEINRKENK
jgi:hypothetical protein